MLSFRTVVETMVETRLHQLHQMRRRGRTPLSHFGPTAAPRLNESLRPPIPQPHATPPSKFVCGVVCVSECRGCVWFVRYTWPWFRIRNYGNVYLHYM